MCYYFENSDFDFSFPSSQEKNSVVLYPIFKHTLVVVSSGKAHMYKYQENMKKMSKGQILDPINQGPHGD